MNRSAAIISAALLAAAPLLAQNAELSGLISDPSHRAVFHAAVVVQNLETGVTRAVLSNQQGEYSVPALIPGAYDITVEATGFKPIHQTGVVVEVDQRARLDFSLSVGSKSEIITVQGSAPLLNASLAIENVLSCGRIIHRFYGIIHRSIIHGMSLCIRRLPEKVMCIAFRNGHLKGIIEGLPVGQYRYQR